MEKLENIRTKNEILELQKNDKLTISLTKEQARVIGFAIGTEINENEKCIKELQKDLKNKEITSEQRKIINDTILFLYEQFKILYNMRENLKKFYGTLID